VSYYREPFIAGTIEDYHLAQLVSTTRERERETVVTLGQQFNIILIEQAIHWLPDYSQHVPNKTTVSDKWVGFVRGQEMGAIAPKNARKKI
jgi:hypothetical protein